MNSGKLPEGSGPPESGERSFKVLRTEVQAEGRKRRGAEGCHGCGGEKLEQGSDPYFLRHLAAQGHRGVLLPMGLPCAVTSSEASPVGLTRPNLSRSRGREGGCPWCTTSPTPVPR